MTDEELLLAIERLELWEEERRRSRARLAREQVQIGARMDQVEAGLRRVKRLEAAARQILSLIALRTSPVLAEVRAILFEALHD